MKSLLITILFLLFGTSLNAQWALTKVGSSGKYQLVVNDEEYQGLEAGSLYSLLQLNAGAVIDTSLWGFLRSNTDGKYRQVYNKAEYLGRDSGTVIANLVYNENEGSSGDTDGFALTSATNSFTEGNIFWDSIYVNTHLRNILRSDTANTITGSNAIQWTGVTNPTVGTTDNQVLSFKTNGVVRVEVDNDSSMIRFRSGNELVTYGFVTGAGGMVINLGTVNMNSHIVRSGNSNLMVYQLQNASSGVLGTDGLTLSLSGSDVYMFNRENGFMVFGTSGTERARFKNDGEFLIGTTTDAGAYVLQVNGDINMTTNSELFINGTQVVQSRVTGWTAPTGTAARTTFVTSTVTTEQLAERVKALIDDLMTHGLIGN